MKTNPADFGLTEEEAVEATRNNILPTFNTDVLDQNPTGYVIEILEDKPRMLTYTDKATGKTKETRTIKILDSATHTEMTLWLSAKTLCNALFKVAEKRGTLKNAKVLLSKRTYNHPKFGESTAYEARIVESD